MLYPAVMFEGKLELGHNPEKARARRSGCLDESGICSTKVVGVELYRANMLAFPAKCRKS